MIPLLILAAVLLGVTFLLLAPVRLQVDFQKEFSAQVRYLFLRFPLVSAGKEGEAPSMQGPPAEEEPPPSGSGLGRKLRAMLRRQGLRGFLRSLQELALAAENSAKSLLRKIRLKRFDLYICLGGEEDAAAAAVLYGQVCGVAYSACGILWEYSSETVRLQEAAFMADLDFLMCSPCFWRWIPMWSFIKAAGYPWKSLQKKKRTEISW